MLVTFSSDAYENITMFGDIAKHLLKIMGHSGTVPGAMVAEEIPEALTRLQKGVEKSKKNEQLSAAEQTEENDEEPQISLAHRALPLINMLKAASAKKCNIMWE